MAGRCTAFSGSSSEGAGSSESARCSGLFQASGGSADAISLRHSEVADKSKFDWYSSESTVPVCRPVGEVGPRPRRCSSCCNNWGARCLTNSNQCAGGPALLSAADNCPLGNPVFAASRGDTRVAVRLSRSAQLVSSLARRSLRWSRFKFRRHVQIRP
jgi:hypothetical protein